MPVLVLSEYQKPDFVSLACPYPSCRRLRSDTKVSVTRVKQAEVVVTRVPEPDVADARIEIDADLTIAVTPDADVPVPVFPKSILLFPLFPKLRLPNISQAEVENALVSVADASAADVVAADVPEAQVDGREGCGRNLCGCGAPSVSPRHPPASIDAHQSTAAHWLSAEALRSPANTARISEAVVLAALEPHRQIIGDCVHRDPLLRHGVALAHRDGAVLE
jgi:hypothetical protein